VYIGALLQAGAKLSAAGITSPAEALLALSTPVAGLLSSPRIDSSNMRA
jgi:hypothetical protein